jgi:hypothetical protein
MLRPSCAKGWLVIALATPTMRIHSLTDGAVHPKGRRPGTIGTHMAVSYAASTGQGGAIREKPQLFDNDACEIPNDHQTLRRYNTHDQESGMWSIPRQRG